MAGIRDIDEDACAVLLELKRFRVSAKPHIPESLSGRGIDQAERAVSVARVQLFGERIIADVIGIVR